MKTYTLKVYASNSLAQKLKKIAALRGKSVSETAAEMIDIGLNLPDSSTTEAPTIGSVSFGEHPSASGLSPEIVRFLVETVAANYALQKKFSRLHWPDNFKEHQERVRVAEGEALEDIKSLGLDHILNPVKAAAVAKAEAILKDLCFDAIEGHTN